MHSKVSKGDYFYCDFKKSGGRKKKMLILSGESIKYVAMKLRKLAFLLGIAAAALTLGGCNVGDETTAHQKSTFLGIYTYEPACFAPTRPSSIKVRTEDISGMELPSGDRTQFLWGLVSIEDY